MTSEQTTVQLPGTTVIPITTIVPSTSLRFTSDDVNSQNPPTTRLFSSTEILTSANLVSTKQSTKEQLTTEQFTTGPPIVETTNKHSNPTSRSSAFMTATHTYMSVNSTTSELTFIHPETTSKPQAFSEIISNGPNSNTTRNISGEEATPMQDHTTVKMIKANLTGTTIYIHL